MNILTIILVLAFQKFFGSTTLEQPDQWIRHWQEWWNKHISNPAVVLILTIFVPPVVLFLLLQWLDSWLITLFVDVLVLLYVMGRGHMRETLETCCEFNIQEDHSVIVRHSIKCFDADLNPHESDLNTIFRQVRAALVDVTFYRFFAVLLWYMFFGAAGALMVRLVLVFPEDSHNRVLLSGIKGAVFWVPARVHSFFIALMGDFPATFPMVWRDTKKMDFSSDASVYDYVLTAMHEDTDRDREIDWSAKTDVERKQRLKATLNLIERTRIAWLVLAACWFLVF
ncbi:regulatory signaling modulator protein AmpE [Gynuella sp.]|uniref:regulatory signaling modulator protein AmpE n=1 Tax=Gynuella sp. TaxID=2969146 RepID=UPI003D111790